MKKSMPLHYYLEHFISNQVIHFDLSSEAKDNHDNTWAYPVKKLPVRNLDNRVVLTQVRLNNGAVYPAMIGNLEVDNLELTKHFITLTIIKDQERFDLARYHDVDYPRSGPESLAVFLSLSLDDVFPISYDISNVVSGHQGIIKGQIPKTVHNPLSREELMRLIVKNL